MSPILREIKRVFEIDYKKYRKNEIYSGKTPICSRNPFIPPNHWMHHYLFPELLLFRKDATWPCDICSEEQVLRIMAEHGLL